MTAICKALSDLIETDVDDETIIVSLGSGQMFSVKDTSRAIWRLIDGVRGTEEIAVELSQMYRKDKGAIQPEIDKFLNEIKEAGLIGAPQRHIAKAPKIR